MQPNQSPPSPLRVGGAYLRHRTRAAALAVVALGAAVLAGWAADVEVLKRILPGLVAMNPTTAVAFVLAGAALFALGGAAPAGGRAAFLSSASAAAVLVIGVVRVGGYLAGVEVGVDQLLFRGRLLDSVGGVPNRVAPNTAVNLVLCGAALLLLGDRRRRPAAQQVGQVLALLVAVTAMLGVLGYVYGAQQFYGVASYIPMAVHTAGGFLVLAFGLLTLRADVGFMRVVEGDGSGGVLARRLLPTVVLVPLVLGWLRLKGQWAGLYNLEFGSALYTICSILMLVGVVWWTAGTLEGVDERRRVAEADLAAAIGRAEAANRAKSDFLANMSHEIRTPMSAVIGYSDLMLDPDQSPSDRLNHVNVVRRNAEYLLAIINDILDLSKIEAGQMVTEAIPCSPCQVIAEVASMMRVRAVERRLDFQVRIEGRIPQTIRTDPTRLRQVLINLTANAIKFTESGWVRLTAKLLDAGGGAGGGPAAGGGPRLRLEVIDTGIGIDPAHLERMFEPFAQAESSTTRRFGGTGLGLPISRRLARAMGGDLEVDSAPGRGSCFAVTVPTGPLEGVPLLDGCTEVTMGRPEATPAAVRLRGRVLLAEDGPDNQRLLSQYLRNAGADVTVAENGRVAADLATATISGGAAGFDLILMDMRMPELDGYAATALLRGRGYAGPIVALTAHAMADDREKCLRAGCTDYLTKPVRKGALLEMVRRHVGDGPEGAAAAIPQATRPLPVVSEAGGRLRSALADADEEVRQYLPTFLDNLPSQVAEIERTLTRGNLEALSEAVHRLKGSGGLYGFEPITAAAARAEQALNAGEVEAIERDVRALTDLVRRVDGYRAAKEKDHAAP